MRINLYSNQNQTKFKAAHNAEVKEGKIRFLADDFYKTATKWFKMDSMGGALNEKYYTIKLSDCRLFFTLTSSN